MANQNRRGGLKRLATVRMKSGLGFWSIAQLQDEIAVGPVKVEEDLEVRLTALDSGKDRLARVLESQRFFFRRGPLSMFPVP